MRKWIVAFDCGGVNDTPVVRVAHDTRNVLATITAMRPSVRQIHLKPLVGGPSRRWLPTSRTTHPIRGIPKGPLIAQAIAQVANGVDVFATPRGASATAATSTTTASTLAI